LKYLGIDRRINIKMDLKKCGRKTWTGFIWLRIRASS
jgi:hypothetical protein